jgi:hypothetical protein
MVVSNKKQFLAKHNLPEKSMLSLEDISNLSGIPMDALQSVYNRGVGAWKSNPESVRLYSTGEKVPDAPRKLKMSKEQWAGARVYAFANKTKKVYYGADNDIREHHNLE